MEISQAFIVGKVGNLWVATSSRVLSTTMRPCAAEMAWVGKCERVCVSAHACSGKRKMRNV